jgi:uncharacterized protein
MKIDVSAHCRPRKFIDAFVKRVGARSSGSIMPSYDLEMSNIDKRIELMNKFPGYVQILTPTIQTLEKYAGPEDDAYLASILNDELAEMVHKYPDKFVAAVAQLPMNNIPAAVKEIDRAIKELGFKGINVPSSVLRKPLDLPEFMPLYERMAEYDLPIWIHPTGLADTPDYAGEIESKYSLYLAFGWPYESTLCMSRLVCSEVMEKYPDLKIITHHAGAMIPFFAGRISMLQMRRTVENPSKQKPIDYFKRFYADTAIYGNTPGLMCAQSFFGTDHMLFGTDMPYGPGVGELYIKLTIDAVDKMTVSDADKKKIYEDNIKQLIGLKI